MLNINKRVIITISSVLFILIISLIVYNTMTFRVIGFNPNLNNISELSPFIEVRFNKALSNNNLSLSSKDNSNIIKSTSVDDKVLIIELNELELNKDYLITINHIESTSGYTLDNKNISFTAKDIPYDDLSDDQKQWIINNQSRFDDGRSDPILDILPASSLFYTVSAIFEVDEEDKDGKLNLILDTKILLSNADLSEDESKIIDNYKKEINNFLISEGFDPSNYKFKYTVMYP